jgi:hypothetical protein
LKDGSGTINAAELKGLCYDLGYYLNEDEAKITLQILDKGHTTTPPHHHTTRPHHYLRCIIDGGGSIDFNEVRGNKSLFHDFS